MLVKQKQIICAASPTVSKCITKILKNQIDILLFAAKFFSDIVLSIILYYLISNQYEKTALNFSINLPAVDH